MRIPGTREKRHAVTELELHASPPATWLREKRPIIAAGPRYPCRVRGGSFIVHRPVAQGAALPILRSPDVETLAHLTLRAIVGLLMAGLLSFAGYIISNLFLPPAGTEEHMLVNIRLVFVGAGGGFGALAGWSIRDDTRPPMLLLFVVAMIGGFLGGWVGLMFAEGTSNVIDLWTRHLHVTQATILSAAVGANLLLLITGGFAAWRGRDS